MRSLHLKYANVSAGRKKNHAGSLLHFGLFLQMRRVRQVLKWESGLSLSPGTEAKFDNEHVVCGWEPTVVLRSRCVCVCARAQRRMFVVEEGRGTVHARHRSSRIHKHIHTHGPSCVRVPSQRSFLSLFTCYLAFSGLGWTAPHETLIDNPQVLLPVVHFEAVDMGAACGTHGSSQSIRALLSLWAKKTFFKSPQRRPSPRTGWLGLACQVRYPAIAALRLTGHVLVAVTETRAAANIKTTCPTFLGLTWNIVHAFKSRTAPCAVLNNWLNYMLASWLKLVSTGISTVAYTVSVVKSHLIQNEGPMRGECCAWLAGAHVLFPG